MRYLDLVLDKAMQNDGSFKTTSKGNLPTRIVKQASELLPEFAVSEYERHISISEYVHIPVIGIGDSGFIRITNL